MDRILIVVRAPDGGCLDRLADGPYEVVRCADGNDCLKRLDDSAKAAVIQWELDGDVPGPNLLVRVLQKYPRLPVIVVSSLLGAKVVDQATVKGARAFLQWPLEAARLPGRLQELLQPAPYAEALAKLKRKLVGESPAWEAMLQNLAKAAGDDRPVLFTGEEGVGKEYVARTLHEYSGRTGDFVVAALGALSPNLMEAELFGKKKGAHNDAVYDEPGRLELAKRGTVLLDEIGELPLEKQTVLLTVLQTRVFQRVGASKDQNLEARVFAATNRDVVRLVAEKKFRKDLYERFTGGHVRIPALHERRDDWLLLLEQFIEQHAAGRPERKPVRIAEGVNTYFREYHFSSNVRGFKSYVEHALQQCTGDFLELDHFPLPQMAVNLREQRAARDDASPADGAAEAALRNGQAAAPPLNGLAIPRSTFLDEQGRFTPLLGLEGGILADALREYLNQLMIRAGGVVKTAAKLAGTTEKTLRIRLNASFPGEWNRMGKLPPRPPQPPPPKSP